MIMDFYIILITITFNQESALLRLEISFTGTIWPREQQHMEHRSFKTYHSEKKRQKRLTIRRIIKDQQYR